MFSILIPTYNYSAVLLVKTLQKQLLNQEIPFEIICFDNGSNGEANSDNEKINRLEFCRFKALKNDAGRSKVRNLLAENAQYSWLLFLDADVLPVNDQFIRNYIEEIKNNPGKVFYGGLKYYDEKPSSDKILRWIYGKKREEISFDARKLTDGIHFSSANFLIEKSLFKKIKFDETLTKYGHEDTLFAIELLKDQNKIYQVDCPVYHLGLDDNAVFLEKTKKAVENLKNLHLRDKIRSQDIKLLKISDKVKAYGLKSLFSMFYKVFYKKMERNLTSKNPSIFIFDIYKLSYLCSIS